MYTVNTEEVYKLNTTITTDSSRSTSSDKLFTTKDIALIPMFSALIAVCSWISIPTAVPFTLQTFAVFCALCLLGGKRGFFSVLVYILLGAVGVPVFSGFKGGFGVLLGVTGGYIIGFLVLAAVYWCAEVIIGEHIAVKIASMILGLAFCYTFGTVWFVALYTKNVGDINFIGALQKCVFPFLIWDMIKLSAAVGITLALKKRIKL